jgi:hypothetical protein
MRRSFNGSLHLRSGEIADANHADVAIRPRLSRGPLNEVVHIAAFLPVKKPKGPAGTTGAPAIRDYVDVTTRDEEIGGASFNEAGWCTEILNLSRIGRGGNQYGPPTGFGRTMHIRQQHDSVTHRHGNVVIL